MSSNLDSSEFPLGDRALLSGREETDSREQKSSMYSEDEDEGQSNLELAASAKDTASSATLAEIERCSEDESEEDAGLPPSSTEVQSTETNSLDAGPKNYPTLLPCHCCELILTSLDNYKKHCREQHYSHSCRFCDTMTVSYGRLKKHLQTCHPTAMKEEMKNEDDIESDEEKSGLDDCDEPEPLLSKSCKKKCRRCTKCGFASDDLVEFGNHMFNVHGDKKYKAKLINCSLCPFMTYIQHHMDYHMNSEHLKQRIYQCDKCEYSGYNLSMLNSHANSHSPVHRFRCEDCNFVAKHSNLMKVHVRRTGHKRAPDWNKDGSLPSYLITADVLQRLISQKKQLGAASDISDELLNQVEKHIRSLDDEDQLISSSVNNGLKIGDWQCSIPSVDGSQGKDHITTSRSLLPPLPDNPQPTISRQAGHPVAPPPAVNFSSSMFQQQHSLSQPFPVQYPQFPALPQLPFPQQLAKSNLPFNQGFAFGPQLQVSSQMHMLPTLPPTLKQQQQQLQDMMMMVAQVQQALHLNYPPTNLANPAMGMYNFGFPHPFQIAHLSQTNPWPLQNTMSFGNFQPKADPRIKNSHRSKSRRSRRTPQKVPENNTSTLTDGNTAVASPLQHIKNGAVDNSSMEIAQPTTHLLPSGAVGESPEYLCSVMTTETTKRTELSRITDEGRLKEEKVVESADVSFASAKGELLETPALEDRTMKTRIKTENAEDVLPRCPKVNDLKISNFCKSKRSLDSICDRLMIKKLKKEDTRKQMELN